MEGSSLHKLQLGAINKSGSYLAGFAGGTGGNRISVSYRH